jgi:hypothetical protein
MYGPESAKWVESDNSERTALESKNCWRPLEDGELLPDDEIVPIVCIYTKKRCGKYKCRAVALGNRQKSIMAGECYSPTISHAGNRFLLIESAASGAFIEQFDISNAFIQATLSEKVICLLPKHWTADSSHKSRLVRLLKSLYGLRVAPRRWFDAYRAFLEKEGWEMCDREPGLFRKTVNGKLCLLAVYVDDSLLSCICNEALVSERKKILSHFEGKIVDGERSPDGETEIRDLLGATLRYNRSARTMKIDAESAIDTLLKKYRMTDTRPLSSPMVKHQVRAKGHDETDTSFPIRSLVGSIQYIAGVCRPDISFAASKLGQRVAAPTKGLVADAKRVLAYLKGTKTYGLEYSKAQEEEFQTVFGEIA